MKRKFRRMETGLPTPPDIILPTAEASLVGKIPGLRGRAAVQAVIDQLAPNATKPGLPMA